ncbi:MAG: serine esterase [Verrucomicrobia bacterium]|nr:serine esterase [Verrucomicrobiota bacterium]
MLVTDFVSAQEKESRRLMIVLHGLGDSMEGFRWLPQVLNLPWMNYLLVNAPDAYYSGFAWFDLYTDSAVGIKRSRELVFELLEDLEKKGFAPEHTMLLGFSQGCLMCYEVGLLYPRLLAGVVGISGWPHEPEKLLAEQSPFAKQQKFLITHGTNDPLVPFDKVKPAVKQLQEAGLNIDWREFQKAHTIAGEEEISVIREFIGK